MQTDLANLAAPLSPAQRDELQRVLAAGCTYIDHPDFHTAGAEQRHTRDADLDPVDLSDFAAVLSRRSMDNSRSRPRLPQPMDETAERAAFLRFNYARFRAAQLRAAAEAGNETACRETLAWRHRALNIRNLIVAEHLALVLSCLRRRADQFTEGDDHLSAGVVALIRQVETYDPKSYRVRFFMAAMPHVRGAMSHLSRAERRYRARVDQRYEGWIAPATNTIRDRRQEHEDYLVERLAIIVKENRAGLSRDEYRVLKARFWNKLQPAPCNPLGVLKIDRVASKTHMDRKRAWPLLRSALAKLRHAVERVLSGERIAALVQQRRRQRLAA